MFPFFVAAAPTFTPHLVPHLVSSLHKIRYVVVELVEYTGDDEVDINLMGGRSEASKVLDIDMMIASYRLQPIRTAANEQLK